MVVTDIGGGSSELILGRTAPPVVEAAFSMDVGSVRLTERHLQDDPPTSAQVAAVAADVDAALDEAGRHVPFDTGAVLVGVAGTVTTLAAITLGLESYDSARIHGVRIGRVDLEAAIAELLGKTHAERTAIGSLHPGRVDVIGAGAIVVRTIMRRLDAAAIVVSEHDILDGIALSLVDAG